MNSFHYFRVATTFYLGLLFLCLPFSVGQEVPTASAAGNASEPDLIAPLEIKLSVNEVVLDVVVLDKKTGNPITDLTAADFEVYQDNRRQEIKSSVYIDSRPDEAAQPAAVLKDAPNFPISPAVVLKKEDVRRTIIFIVDDIAINDLAGPSFERRLNELENVFGDVHYARMALRNFVEKQMRPGDLVAVLRTSRGSSARQMFLSDKSPGET